MPFEPGRTVRFPKGTCAACPLRERCTASSNGRSVSIHPDEALLAELRHRQQTPEGRGELRERVAVEHALAHIGHWQARRARYRGTRKNLLDLRRVAVVDNLHIIARQPVTDSYQLAALRLPDRRSRRSVGRSAGAATTDPMTAAVGPGSPRRTLKSRSGTWG
jgi:hypothetical protein